MLVETKKATRHCEERSDEAIYKRTWLLDCFTASGSQ
jgi:hypothetical protein